MHTRGLNVHAEVSGTVRQQVSTLFTREQKVAIILYINVCEKS